MNCGAYSLAMEESSTPEIGDDNVGLAQRKIEVGVYSYATNQALIRY